MHYTPKHARPRAARKVRSRVLGVMAAGGATIATSVISSAPAQADSGVWDRVAQCESGGNWSISTGNGFYGGLQFTLGSWRAAGGSRYAAKPHHASRAAQIAVAQNLLRMQGPGAWPVCSRRAGLTRANGLSASFASVASVATASPSMAPTQSTVAVRGLKGYASRAQVRDLQTWAGVARDGKWGTATTRAVQKKLGLRASGYIDAATVRQVERLLGISKSGHAYINKATMRGLMSYAAARVA